MALNPRDTNMFEYDKQARAFQALQGQANPSTMKQGNAALDEAINAIASEVSRYQNSLYRLIERLEAPRPEDGCDCQPEPQPRTLAVALAEIHSKLVNATDTLDQTRKRIEEQVGELKILP